MLPGTLFRDRDEYERVLETAARKADVKLSAPVTKAILSALSERDETAAVYRVGYEINFNRYFYCYTAPRPLEEIEADIRGIETDILRMLAEVTGGR